MKRAKTLVNLAKRSRAKRKGLKFDITPENIGERIANGKCEVSGVPFDIFSTVGRNAFAPSLDRINSDGGYTTDNVQVVCKMFNFGKNEFPQVDFIAMCCAVAELYRDDPAVIQRLKEVRNAEF